MKVLEKQDSRKQW